MRIHQITETQQQYHGGNNYHFTIPHTGNNSHTFGNYNSTRYGVFFTNNPKFAKLYGEPKKFVLNIKNTLDLDNPDSQKILNHFYKIIKKLNDRELFLNIQHILNYGPYWQLFEDDVGKIFTKFLKKHKYDSAKFTETNTDDNDKEITSETIVVLDTNKIRQDKNNQPDLFDDEPIKLIKENNNNIIGYHGSNNTNITQFSKEFSGKNTGSTDTKFGTFFFTNPKAALTYLETLPIDYIKDDPEYQQYIFTDTEKQYNQELNKFSQKIKEMFPELLTKKPELNDNEKLLKYFLFDLYDDNTLTIDQKIEFKNNREIQKLFITSHRLRQNLFKNIKKEKINSDYLLYGAIYKCELNIDPYIINTNKTDYTQKQYNLWLKQARDSGNNSLIIKNVYDAGDYGPLSDVIIVFDDNYINIIDKKIYENYPAPAWMKNYDDEPIKLIKENSITINQLLNQFKKEYQQSIEYGCKRNNCGIPAADLEIYAKKYNLNVPRISGYFIADKPQLSIKDFTPTEIQSMKNQNLNPNNKKDRYNFAKQNNLLDELKYIPHYWNTHNNQIIDLTAHKQFIETNLATDTNPTRYTTNNPYTKT